MNKNKQLKIFVSAYACEPDLGSEIGVGWHWVLEMSKYYNLWVLTRKSNQDSIENWLKSNPDYSNINFIYFDLPYYLRFWKKGMRGVRTYYNIWQWCTNTIVKKTMQSHNIKIFHHLTYGNTLWSVSRYGQKQFFIWGPTGGVDTIPTEYSRHYDSKGRFIEWLRRTVVKTLPFNYGFNHRCKNANLILCKTDILRNTIPTKHRGKAILFTDVAVKQREFPEIEKAEKRTTIKYLTVGKLDPWRGFDLLIESFKTAVKKNNNIELQILGKGLDEGRLKSLIATNSLENHVFMLGEVSMDEYFELLNNCDVVVNASLKEGAVTTSFDSMALGKPLICIDTTGYTRYFTNEYAIVIRQQNRKSMISSLEESILKLTDENIRQRLGANAQKAGINFSWEARGLEIKKTINEYFLGSKTNER